jgi:hypothetical protein
MLEVKCWVPLVRLGFVHSLVLLENGWVVNLRPDGAHRGKRSTLSGEGRGELCGMPRPPMW